MVDLNSSAVKVMPDGEAEQVDDLLGPRADQVSAEDAAGPFLDERLEAVEGFRQHAQAAQLQPHVNPDIVFRGRPPDGRTGPLEPERSRHHSEQTRTSRQPRCRPITASPQTP
jgi:hypothetical protein